MFIELFFVTSIEITNNLLHGMINKLIYFLYKIFMKYLSYTLCKQFYKIIKIILLDLTQFIKPPKHETAEARIWTLHVAFQSSEQRCVIKKEEKERNYEIKNHVETNPLASLIVEASGPGHSASNYPRENAARNADLIAIVLRFLKSRTHGTRDRSR